MEHDNLNIQLNTGIHIEAYEYIEDYHKPAEPVNKDREMDMARKGNYSQNVLIHRNRLQQLKSDVVLERLTAEQQIINAGCEVIGAMDFKRVGVTVKDIRKENMFKQLSESYYALQRELKSDYSDNEPVSREEWLSRQAIKYRAYREIFEQYSGVSELATDFEKLEKYQKMLANFASKFEVDVNGQEVYERTTADIDDNATKGLAATDALLIRKYNEGGNTENLALIYNLVNRPPIEKRFIYGLLEKNLTDGVDLLDVVDLTGTYIPNPAKILERLTPNRFFRMLGKTNLYTKKIMQAMQLCDRSRAELDLITSVAATLNVEKPYEDEAQYQDALAAGEEQVIIRERAMHFLECIRISQDIKTWSSKKASTDAEKEEKANKIETLREELRNNFVNIIELDNRLPDNEAIDATNYEEPVKEENVKLKKALKLGAGVAMASPKLLNLANNIAKQPLNIIGSMGAAIGTVAENPVAAMNQKWNLPFEAVAYFKGEGKEAQLNQIGDWAKDIKPTLNALNIVGTTLSSILLVMSGVNYVKGFLKMTTADRLVGAVELANSTVGVGNGINTICKGIEVGSKVTETTVAGAFSIAMGTINVGVGTYQLADNYFVRDKKRQLAREGLAAETEKIKKKHTKELGEAEAERRIKAKEQFDQNMLRLSETMAERRNSAAVNKLLVGSLTLGAGILTLVGAPVATALLGLGALGFGLYGMITSIHDKQEAMREIIDNYLEINDQVEKWRKSRGYAADSLEARQFRKKVRMDRIQSQGFSNEKAYFSKIMMGCAITIHDKIFSNQTEDAKAYEDLVKSMGLKVKPSSGYPTVQMIHSKLMS